MVIETVNYKGRQVIAVSGDIDMYTSPELRKELMKLINRKESHLFVDFKGVSYIDSSGIATFVEALKGMMSYGGKLKFAAIPDGILQIFSFSKLDKIFEIHGNLDEALDS